MKLTSSAFVRIGILAIVVGSIVFCRPVLGATCNISSTTSHNFGAYTPSTGPAVTVSSIVLRCTSGAPYTVALSPGTTTGATIAQRLMNDAIGNTLQYNLYRDAGHTQVWGNTLGVDTVSGIGAGLGVGNNITHSVFGRIPDNNPNLNAIPGVYTDTITVTVQF